MAVKDSKQPFNGQLNAENSMMKKRLPLIERENDVLKKENQQHGLKIQELEMKNRQLGVELTSLSEKYTDEKSIGEQQISNLQETIQKIEADNNKRVGALISQKKELEAKLVRESHALNEQIVMQKKAFNREREQITQENAKKKLEWSTELGVLKKKLEPKELQISSLKLAINEISMQLGGATALSEELRKSRDETLAELESVKAANTDLSKKLAELESVKATNTNLSKKLAELESVKATNANLSKKLAELESVKATNANLSKKLAELESVKATNANLNKKIAELSANKLSSQNSPTKTNP
jgi:chromosome segregation ATPase